MEDNLENNNLFLSTDINKRKTKEVDKVKKVLNLINDFENNESIFDSEIKENYLILILSTLRSSLILCDPNNFLNLKDKILTFLNKYNKYLTKANRLLPLVCLDNDEILENYIINNYDYLKTIIKETNIIITDIFTVKEYYDKRNFLTSSDLITSENNFYVDKIQVPIHNKNYILYKYFKNDIKFIYKDLENTHSNLYGFLNHMNIYNLFKVLYEEYKSNNIDNVNEVVTLIKNENIYNYNKIDTYPFIEKDFIYLIYNLFTDYNNELRIFFNNCEKYTISNLKPTKNKNFTTLKSPNYLKNLLYLKTLSTAERKENDYYLYAFSLFKKMIEENTKDSSLDPKIIELLFNRHIKFLNSFDYFKMDEVRKIYFYFKTNELINFTNSSITLSTLNNLNIKQYNKLIEESKIKLKYPKEELNNVKKKIIILLDYFNYDVLNKWLKVISIKEIYLIYNKIKDNNNEDYKTKLIKFINEDINILKNQEDFNSLLKVFTYLYNNKYEKITQQVVLKRIKSLEYLLFPNNYNIKNNLDLLDFIAKGEPYLEKIEALKLYDEFRFRTLSTIPDIFFKDNNLTCSTVNMHDQNIISNGIGKYLFPNGVTSSSCLTPNGKASTSLRHGAINPNGRFFKIEYNNKIIAYSWLWRSGDVLCFDNIEVQEYAKEIPDFQNKILSLYIKAANLFIKETNNSIDSGIKLVVVGKNKLDIINNPLKKLEKITNTFKPNSNSYLYLDDSKEIQYILGGSLDKVKSTKDIEPIYKYKRQSIKKLSNLKKDERNLLLNSIYFDYCIYTNKKYIPKEDNYIEGYYNEDWLIGINKLGSYDFYYRELTDDIIKESSIIKPDILNLNLNPNKIIIKDDISTKLLSNSNYNFKEEEIIEYLNSLEENKYQISNNYFFHAPKDINTTYKIFKTGAITSSHYGKRTTFGANNGIYYISIAKVNTEAYREYIRKGGFLIDEDICAFETNNLPLLYNDNYKVISLKDSKYPIRVLGIDGEWQVYEKILLDKCKAYLVNEKNIIDIIKLTYIEEYFNNNLKLVTYDKLKVIDQNEIKRLVKSNINYKY